jgi:DNA polymerase elongation subunit (family B)
MKVILKGGSPEKNKEIEKFFMENIFSILIFGIAIEPSDAVITVHEKQKDGTVKKYIDPTAEVIVELTEEARNLAKKCKTPANVLKKKSGKFYDEAQAIEEIEMLKPPFSVEYYSCRYTPPAEETTEPECDVHGSIEHMQSSNGLCPGCGKR